MCNGGNSHQRAIEKAKATQEPGGKVTVAEEMAEWGKPLNRADSIGILGILAGAFFVIIVPTFWSKLPALVLVCFGFVYLIWLSHWTYRLTSLCKLAILVLILLPMNLLVIPQFVDQWHFEHLRSELKSDASATNLTYPDGDRFGIKWSKSFTEVKLAITSEAHFPIQNMNLSISVIDRGDEIAGMAQLPGNEIDGCVIRRPRQDLISKLTILGADGSTADITSTMNDQISKVVPIDHYDVLCQRIGAGESVRLILATITHRKDGDATLAPDHLRITGDYETTPSEGSKRVRVDEIIDVPRPQRWK